MTTPPPLPTPAPPAPVGTRERLLDAAERLFAQNGIDASSLRAITTEAATNLAAVHYHFGSKDGLVREVFERRLGPMNQRRLELLDEVVREAPAGSPPAVREVVRAFLEPVARMGCGDPGREPPPFPRLLTRAFDEPEGRARDIVLGELREVTHRFVEALRGAGPELPPRELHWRFFFMVGAMAHTVSHRQLLPLLLEDSGADETPEVVLERLVTFLAAGWAAPPTAVVEDPNGLEDTPTLDEHPSGDAP